MVDEWPPPRDAPDLALPEFLDAAGGLHNSDDQQKPVRQVTHAAVDVMLSCDVAGGTLVQDDQIVTREPTRDSTVTVDSVDHEAGGAPCPPATTLSEPSLRSFSSRLIVSRHVQRRATFHERLLASDDSALDELYNQYSATVYGVALRVTSNRAAADDITQSVFIDVWARPQRWDPDRGSFRPWLATVAHRRAVDWMRHEQAIYRRDSRALAEAQVPPDVEEAVQAVLVTENVRAALAALPQEQREVIHLAYFNAKTYRQVAADLGLPEGTVKSRIRAGLAQLAKTLQPN